MYWAAGGTRSGPGTTAARLFIDHVEMDVEMRQSVDRRGKMPVRIPVKTGALIRRIRRLLREREGHRGIGIRQSVQCAFTETDADGEQRTVRCDTFVGRDLTLSQRDTLSVVRDWLCGLGGIVLVAGGDDKQREQCSDKKHGESVHGLILSYM